MSGIRVSTGVKKIEVNDEGEYITLNFADQDFPRRVFAMMDRVQERADKAKDEEGEIVAAHPDGSFEQARALTDFNVELHRYVMAEVDGVFGEGTCRKVFGDIVPGIDLFQDFFEQLMPYFEQFGKERQEKMSKYSAARTGNV